MNLLRKADFRAKVEIISSQMKNMYVDLDTLRDNTHIINVASAKSMGSIDPLITVKALYEMPVVRTTILDPTTNAATETILTDSTAYRAQVRVYTDPAVSSESTDQTLTFLQICKKLMNMLDQKSILSYIRKYYTNNGNTTVIGSTAIKNYYNQIVWLFEALVALVLKFNDEIGDIHAALGVLSSING